MPARPLIFVVGTGRTGSTVLSRIFRLHPDILSINELFVSVGPVKSLPEKPLDGAEFWQILTAPNAGYDAMIANGTPLPEFLYPRLKERRYSAEDGGIPAISLMVLPHLTDDPDALIDVLEREVTTWPTRPVAEQHEALFDLLSAHFGGRVVIERSGHSLPFVPQLRETFPDAKFVHMFRDGPDCALSMSRHLGFRSSALGREVLEHAGVGSVEELTLDHLQQLPPDLLALVGGFSFDAVRDRPMALSRFGTLWSEMIVEGVGHLAKIPADRRMSLKYEELLAARESELTRLAEFAGVDPDPDWLRAGAELLDAGKPGAATRLAPDELTDLRRSCEPGVAALAESH
jgi:hypothetical protein